MRASIKLNWNTYIRLHSPKWRVLNSSSHVDWFVFKAAATWIRTLTSWESWKQCFTSLLYISSIDRSSPHRAYGNLENKSVSDTVILPQRHFYWLWVLKHTLCMLPFHWAETVSQTVFFLIVFTGNHTEWLQWINRSYSTWTPTLERYLCQFSHVELLNLLQTLLSHRTSPLAKALTFNLVLRHQRRADHILIIVKSGLQRINPLVRVKCTWLIKWFYFSLFWLEESCTCFGTRSQSACS